MIRRIYGICRPTLLLAAALGGFVVAVGSAHGTFDASADFLLGRDAVAMPAVSVAADSDPPDGRSRVPARWKAHFARFAHEDHEQGVVEGGVVFVGSSSIDYWSDLPAQFPTHAVIQRGLPGGTMADCARYADRLVLPYRPRVVVVYAGDNDLAAGVAPERIVADLADLVDRVHGVAPAARVVVLSIKPSPAREALLSSVRRTNALMAAYARTDRRLDFVDVHTAMLDDGDHARQELFRADGLHMTSMGYGLWRDALIPHLN